MAFSLAVSVALSVIILYILLKRDPKPVLGIYTQKGKLYHIKYAIAAAAYFLIKHLRRHYIQRKQHAVVVGQLVTANSDAEEKDRPQSLSDHAKAFDGIYFKSAGKVNDGEVYAVMGCERRPLGICNGFFYISIPGKGLLCSKKLPDTLLFGTEIAKFGAEGLKVNLVEPMKEWTLSYQGQMWYKNDPEKLVNVDFKGTWHATDRYCAYGGNSSTNFLSAIAKETWSGGFFKWIRSMDASYYEQFGKLDCQVTVDGDSHKFELSSLKKHGYGHKRDWSSTHRYVTHEVFLEDGSKLSLNVLCQPTSVSTLQGGLMVSPKGKILKIKWTDWNIYEHGENGNPPTDYIFRYKAGQKVYTAQVLVVNESMHYMSDNWDVRIVDRFCKFIINGVPGYGLSEFGYRHTGGRPEAIARNDPKWYKDRFIDSDEVQNVDLEL